MKTIRAALACAFLCAAATQSAAATFSFGSVDNGWFRNTGQHSSSNTNIITGFGDTLRSFQRFDIRNLTGDEVTNAQITFRGGNGQFRGAGSEAVQLFDVTSSPFLLSQSFGGGSATGIGVFNDLGTGTIYGGRSIVAGTGGPMPTFTVILNGNALSALTTALQQGSSTFAIGVRSPTLGSNESLWYDSIGTQAARLIVETTTAPVPLPAGGALLAGALAVFGLSRRKASAKARRAA